MSTSTFLTESVMQGEDWRGLELAVVRLLMHAGWKSVQDVGQSGDKGADILAVKKSSKSNSDESYIFQVKAISGASYVGVSAIEQVVQGQAEYGAKIAIVVTNGDFTKSARVRQQELMAQGFDVRLWNGAFLVQLLKALPEYSPNKRGLREYQSSIVNDINDRYLTGARKSLFILATGLGKTVVASTAANLLMSHGLTRVLVLCHSVDLAHQLQREFWSQISKSVPTRVFHGGEPPVSYHGINFGLYQTLHGYLGGVDSDMYDLIIVDEAHHALANGFISCINHLTPKHLIGMTATPWRSDGQSIEYIFGKPIAKVSLIDGMKMGYLAQVDYRLMCDNIDWENINTVTNKSVTISDLNKRLFVPQRDEAVINSIINISNQLSKPRIAIFSPSVVHAEEFARKLVSNNIPAANLSISDKTKRRSLLLKYSSGQLQAVTSVDVLNEGIDVPDVNILVFLRATHSRRIFVQQLGRGLRIAPGKDKVVVLDFVSDIRRMAAVVEIDNESRVSLKKGEIEKIHFPNGVVTFSDQKAKSFIDAWLADVSGLQDMADAEKLQFPDPNKYDG